MIGPTDEHRREQHVPAPCRESLDSPTRIEARPWLLERRERWQTRLKGISPHLSPSGSRILNRLQGGRRLVSLQQADLPTLALSAAQVAAMSLVKSRRQ